MDEQMKPATALGQALDKIEAVFEAVVPAARQETPEENMARLERELYRNPLVVSVSIMTEKDMDALEAKTRATLGLN